MLLRVLVPCAAALALAACENPERRDLDVPSGRVTEGSERSGTAYSPAMDEHNERRTSTSESDRTRIERGGGQPAQSQHDIRRGPAAPTAPYGSSGTAAGNTGEGAFQPLGTGGVERGPQREPPHDTTNPAR